MRRGYVRFSTDQQNADPQLLRLREAGVDLTYVDEAISGKHAHRPELDRMLDELRPGDVVVIVRLDRLGRSVRNLIDLVARLEKMGVDLLVLDQSIDTRTPVGRFTFHVLAALAELERAIISERTRDGMRAAAARGSQIGAVRTWTDDDLATAIALKSIGTRAEDIAAEIGVSRATVFRMFKSSAAELEPAA